MDLVLEFMQGIISGEGHDGIGGFVIAGNYSVENQECAWQKTYVGRHMVAYKGFGEDKGIWGTWTLPGAKGGFQIWRLAEGAPVAEVEKEENAPLLAPAPQSARAAD
jgi:hypothetical protein